MFDAGIDSAVKKAVKECGSDLSEGLHGERWGDEARAHGAHAGPLVECESVGNRRETGPVWDFGRGGDGFSVGHEPRDVRVRE